MCTLHLEQKPASPFKAMKYFFPVVELRCQGEEYSFSEHVRILARSRIEFDIAKAEKITTIGTYYLHELNHQPFWIVVDSRSISHREASNLANRVLLSLWIARPNCATIFYKFIGTDDAITFLSRFQSNEAEKPVVMIADRDMQRAIMFFERLHAIGAREKRLSLAAFNTISGCFPHVWSVSFILFSTALEALLTYSEDRGLTARLAKSFACLTESTDQRRDRAYRAFLRTYRIRSDLVHGRGNRYRAAGKTKESRRKREMQNLKRLANCSKLLRIAWQVILYRPDALRFLNKSDQQREAFFKRIEAGYSPPNVKIGKRIQCGKNP